MAKKKEEITIRSSTAEYLTYIVSVGDVETSFEMRYEDENIWLTQKLMAALYDVDVRTVNYHIKKIFADSELQEDSVIRKFRITADDGKTYNTNHYSLEMIIAVGFKVNSERAVQFRKWVNQIAKDYTIKGWVMDVERIKRGTYLTEKYFDESGKWTRLSEGCILQAPVPAAMAIVELDGITDSITLDTPLMEAYKDTTSMNSCVSGGFPTLLPSSNAISWTGNVTKIVIQPNWRYL